jgi:uncharacterized protein (UPF0332 family)
MKESGFLIRLAREGKLKLAEPSDEICKSYLRKADDCLRSGKILLDNNLHENSVSECYYAMYNTLTAALFRVGIKCENHSGSIILLHTVFGRKDLSDVIANSKKERIDKQYYVGSGPDTKLTRGSSTAMVAAAEEFMLEMKLLINSMVKEDTVNFRKRLSDLLHQS